LVAKLLPRTTILGEDAYPDLWTKAAGIAVAESRLTEVDPIADALRKVF